MELPDEHDSQRNDERAERAYAGQADEQSAMRGLLPRGLLRCFLGSFLCFFARGLLLGLTLQRSLPFFLGFLFCGSLLLGGKPLFFCLFSLRLFFSKAGGLGFLFRLLPLEPQLLVKIGLQ